VHIHIGKTRIVGKRNMVSLRGDDASLTTLASWRVMRPGAKSTQLSRREKSATFSIVGIVVKKDDGCWWTPMSMDKASNRHQQREVSDSRLPNTRDISLVEVLGRNDSDVKTSHNAPSIGPSIHERAASRGGAMAGKVLMLNSIGIDTMVEGSINLDEVIIRSTVTGNSRSRRDVGGQIGRKNLVNQIVTPG
jgi:hypothetical protein